MIEDTISAALLAKAIAEGKQDLFLLDVRSLEEHQHYNIGGHLIPLPELLQRMHEVPQVPIVVYCHSGHRSSLAQNLLKEAGYQDVKNLSGGVLAFAQYESLA